MDRGNGGDRQAPPRPPKAFVKVHRSNHPNPTSINSTTPENFRNRMESSNNITPTNIERQQVSPSPTTTAPFQPLQNNIRYSNNSNHSISANTISTFSRRRPDVRQLPLPSEVNTTQIVTSTTNFISNPTSSIESRTLSLMPTTPNNVSLQIPRPENERLPNEYVDTPFTINKNTDTLQRHTQQQQQQQQTPLVPNRNQQCSHLNTNISTIDGISVIDSNNIDKLPNRTNSNNRSSSNINIRPNSLPITKQPSFKSNTLCKKEQLQHQFSHCEDNVVTHSSNSNNGIIINNEQLNSITCPQCKRCRCEECQRPRQLPSRWICNNYCFCSPETLIDYVSCLCCVKGLYYHCSNHEMECENEEINCADDPCSCVPYNRTTRWGCLSALSVVLPCLLCYWPMKGCVNVCAKCYAKHSRHGCRCNDNTSNNNNRPNLLNLTTNNSQTQPSTNHHDSTPEKKNLI